MSFLIFRRWKNSIILQSIFRQWKRVQVHLVDKMVHDKHNNELHWTRVIAERYARLCAIMHVHNSPNPPEFSLRGGVQGGGGGCGGGDPPPPGVP